MSGHQGYEFASSHASCIGDSVCSSGTRESSAAASCYQLSHRQPCIEQQNHTADVQDQAQRHACQARQL